MVQSPIVSTLIFETVPLLGEAIAFISEERASPEKVSDERHSGGMGTLLARIFSTTGITLADDRPGSTPLFSRDMDLTRAPPDL